MTRNIDEAEELSSIDFYFVRSSTFRVVHMDGAWGGLTPNGEIQMAIYNERATLPERLTHDVQGRRLGAETDRQGPKGIERELEVDIRINLEKALAMREWLSSKIQDLQKRMEIEAEQ